MLDKRNLSEVCNKVCLEPLYTGRCKDECLRRFRKAIGMEAKTEINVGHKRREET